MARGTQIVAMLICIILAVGMLGSLGAYGAVNADSYENPTTGDKNRIIQAFEDQRSSVSGVAELNPIASFIIGALNTLEVMWIVVSDTSALLQLLGAPPAVGNAVEQLARVGFGFMIMYAIIRMRLD